MSHLAQDARRPPARPRGAVVVPARNAAATVGACVTARAALDYPRLEILVVDDGSGDRTAAVARQAAAAAGGDVQVLRTDPGGPARARNLGARRASGALLFFTDADAVVPADWIAALLPGFAEPGVGAVGGPTTPAAPRASAWARYEQLRLERQHGTAPGFVEALRTCNLAVSRPVFEACGGFDETFRHASGEDFDLCRRIRDAGHRILFLPGAPVRHPYPESAAQRWGRAFRYGTECHRLLPSPRGPLLAQGGGALVWLARQLAGTPRPLRLAAATYLSGVYLGRAYGLAARAWTLT